MKKFSKKQRHEIYKLAYEYFKINEFDFMCSCISMAMFKLKYKYYKNTELENKIELPEFFSKKPQKQYSANCWFDVFEREPRIKIFEQIIEETK